ENVREPPRGRLQARGRRIKRPRRRQRFCRQCRRQCRRRFQQHRLLATRKNTHYPCRLLLTPVTALISSPNPLQQAQSNLATPLVSLKSSLGTHTPRLTFTIKKAIRSRLITTVL